MRKYFWESVMKPVGSAPNQTMVRQRCDICDSLDTHQPVAICWDPMMAEKIVAALNKQEEACSAKTQS